MGKEEEDDRKTRYHCTVTISEKIWVEEALWKCAVLRKTEIIAGPQRFDANLLFDYENRTRLLAEF